VDVRNPKIYQGRKVANAINIPLNNILDRIDEIKTMKNQLFFVALQEIEEGRRKYF